MKSSKDLSPAYNRYETFTTRQGYIHYGVSDPTDNYDEIIKNLPKPKICSECYKEYADLGSSKCVGCESYAEHYGF